MSDEIKKEKPFYKKFKLMVWLGSLLINGLTILLGGKLSPGVIAIIGNVLIATIALTTQHTITDVKTSVDAMLIEANDKPAEDVEG